MYYIELDKEKCEKCGTCNMTISDIRSILEDCRIRVNEWAIEEHRSNIYKIIKECPSGALTLRR